MSAPVTRAIALDGPAGSGKSTVARGVAARLGWRYVDTGATYRAATLAVLRGGVDPRTAPAEQITGVVRALLGRGGLRLSVAAAPSQVSLDGIDVSADIRGPEVTAAVSAVSAIPEVRREIVRLQQQIVGTGECVVEGRDIATVVLPHAAVKVYIDASPEVRARRRAGDADAGVRGPGAAPLLDTVSADLARRDRLDSSRAVSPLLRAPDAVVLDTSALTAEQVVTAVIALAEAAGLTTRG